MGNVTWGIVGCGQVAPNHAWAAKRAGGVLKWACDLHADRAKHLAHMFGIEQSTTDTDDLINDKDVEVISICTGHCSHITLAKRFLDRAAVIIEKPLCLPSEDVSTFMEAARSGRASVFVVSQHRFDRSYRKVSEVIKNKEIGSIELARARTLCFRSDEYYVGSDWRGKWRTEGGSALINQGYHALSCLIGLLGVPTISSAQCWTHRTNVIETDEFYCGTMHFGENLLCQVYGSNRAYADWEVVLELYGSKGYVIFDLNYPDRVRSSLPEIIVDEEADIRPPGATHFGISHGDFVASVFDTVRLGTRTLDSLGDGLRTLETIKKFYDAAGIGQQS